MRLYLLSIAAWYGISAVLIALFPTTIVNLVRIDSIVSYNPREVYSVCYGASAILCVVGAIRYNARVRLVAQAVALAVVINWTVLLILGSIASGVSYGGTLIWVWVIIVQAGSIRYYRLSPANEIELVAHFREVMARDRQRVQHASLDGPDTPDPSPDSIDGDGV